MSQRQNEATKVQVTQVPRCVLGGRCSTFADLVLDSVTHAHTCRISVGANLINLCILIGVAIPAIKIGYDVCSQLPSSPPPEPKLQMDWVS